MFFQHVSRSSATLRIPSTKQLGSTVTEHAIAVWTKFVGLLDEQSRHQAPGAVCMFSSALSAELCSLEGLGVDSSSPGEG